MSIDPTILAVLRDLPPSSEPTREVPPGVAADLQHANGKHPGLYTVCGPELLDHSYLESPDGLEQVCANTLLYEVVWVDVDRPYFKCYKTVSLVGYRRPVAFLPFDRVSTVFSTSAAVHELWTRLKSEGWQEV